MRVLCSYCGKDIADGASRPSELCFCGPSCAIASGQPDWIVAALRALEAEAAAKPTP